MINNQEQKLQKFASNLTAFILEQLEPQPDFAQTMMLSVITDSVVFSAQKRSVDLLIEEVLRELNTLYSDTPSFLAPAKVPQNDTPLEAPRVPSEAPQGEASAFVDSEEQKAIYAKVLARKSAIVVRARAGCGKTTTAIKALKLFYEKYPESKMLFVSFANKITKEAKEKIEKANLPCDVLTYHKLGNTLVKRLYARVEKKGSGDRVSYLLKNSIQGRIDKKLYIYVASLLNKARDTAPELVDGTWEDLMAFGFKFKVLRPDIKEEECKVICENTLRALKLAKKEYSVYDVNDMIYLPNVLGLKEEIYDIIVVDECQDTSTACLNIAKSVMMKELKKAGKKECLFLAIGDNKQAIYSWRGADSQALDTIKKDMNAEELSLTYTYRCPKEFIPLVVNHVPDFKSLCTRKGVYESITKEQIKDKAAQGSFILSRTNAPLVPIMFNLLKNGISAKIYGKDIGEKLIKDCRAMIAKLGIKDVSSFIEGVNADTQKRIDAIKWLEKKNHLIYEEQCADITEEKDFLISFFENETDLEFCMGRIETLFTDDKGNHTILSSVHKIKGLENMCVTLLSDTFKMSSEEEKNIVYVAITRSMQRLNFVGPILSL